MGTFLGTPAEWFGACSALDIRSRTPSDGLMAFRTDNFERVVGEIKDGDLFERFAQDLLCHVEGRKFHPLGGIHDSGMDGLDRCYQAEGVQRTVFQMSIEGDSAGKVRRTLTALRKNNIATTRLIYITNRVVKNQDALEEKMYADFGVVVKCRDVTWLRGHVNESEGALRTYLTFVETYAHQFTNGSPLTIDYEKDPRLFVFLRQQWESAGRDARLDEVLVDSLVLFALEGTDPEKNIFRNRQQIVEKISELAGFSSKVVDALLDERLRVLSTKPVRRIKHHRKEDYYCLPYETRIELEEKFVVDAALEKAFLEGVGSRVDAEIQTQKVDAKSARELVLKTVNSLFKRQGLEFSNFIAGSESATSIEHSLDYVISEVVDDSAAKPAERPPLKHVLLAVMRGLIYRGTDDEITYLRRLANTYVMLFLMQVDPKIATYFSQLASKLVVFVDNSILVPAMSEMPLDQRHRRHWNLLVNANRAGVRLVITRNTLGELAGHLRRVLQDYREDYAGVESLYSTEEAIQYVDQMLIRSYLYSRQDGNTESFEEFIGNFVTPSSPQMHTELAIWLKGTFGIRIDDAPSTAEFRQDVNRVAAELTKKKKSTAQARNDAETVLRIRELRRQNDETNDFGVFGFKTWWLSSDTTTQRSVENVLGKDDLTNCYMRADFLHNYVCLAPTFTEVNEVFDVMFPSLLGVNVSHHIPPELSASVRRAIKEHGKYGEARVRAMIGTLSERLKMEAGSATMSADAAGKTVAKLLAS